MLYDAIHVCFIDRTEAPRKGLFVYLMLGNLHVVGPVEIGDDTTRKVRVGVVILIHQVVD